MSTENKNVDAIANAVNAEIIRKFPNASSRAFVRRADPGIQNALGKDAVMQRVEHSFRKVLQASVDPVIRTEDDHQRANYQLTRKRSITRGTRS